MKRSKIMATIVIVLMFITCATVSAEPYTGPGGDRKAVTTLMNEANKLGRVFTMGVNLMDKSFDKMEPGLEVKSAQVAITQLKRLCEMQFNTYSLFKIGMSMKDFADIIMVFASAYALINEIQKDALSYAMKSAKENAIDSKNKELIAFVDKAVELNEKISEIYKKVFKLFYKKLNDSQNDPDIETFRI